MTSVVVEKQHFCYLNTRFKFHPIIWGQNCLGGETICFSIYWLVHLQKHKFSTTLDNYTKFFQGVTERQSLTPGVENTPFKFCAVKLNAAFQKICLQQLHLNDVPLQFKTTSHLLPRSNPTLQML